MGKPKVGRVLRPVTVFLTAFLLLPFTFALSGTSQAEEPTPPAKTSGAEEPAPPVETSVPEEPAPPAKTSVADPVSPDESATPTDRAARRTCTTCHIGQFFAGTSWAGSYNVGGNIGYCVSPNKWYPDNIGNFTDQGSTNNEAGRILGWLTDWYSSPSEGEAIAISMLAGVTCQRI